MTNEQKREFASLLVDVIGGIRAELPTVNWAENLKAEEDSL